MSNSAHPLFLLWMILSRLFGTLTVGGLGSVSAAKLARLFNKKLPSLLGHSAGRLRAFLFHGSCALFGRYTSLLLSSDGLFRFFVFCLCCSPRALSRCMESLFLDWWNLLCSREAEDEKLSAFPSQGTRCCPFSDTYAALSEHQWHKNDWERLDGERGPWL